MTPAEKRWLAQLAAGKSVAQIAKAEKFSVGTMRVYLHNMYKRMGVHNRAQAVAKLRPHVYVFVSGGVVQGARSTVPIDVIVCDYDSLEDRPESGPDERQAAHEREVMGCTFEELKKRTVEAY